MKFQPRFPRLTGTLLVTCFLLGFIAALSPQQIPVSLYKLSLVTTAGLVGYWLDRELFPYARPDVFMQEYLDEDGAVKVSAYPILFSAAMIRRAIVVGCAMLAMGMGA